MRTKGIKNEGLLPDELGIRTKRVLATGERCRLKMKGVGYEKYK